jgi:lysophospholipase L1-like esterase
MSIGHPTTTVRRLFGKALLVVASVMLTLGVAEMVLRLAESIRYEPAQTARMVDPELKGLPSVRGMYALMNPNTRGVYKGVMHRTNSDGFRGPEYAKKTPSNTYRTVLIGDSFTMGSGVPEDDTYARRLERRLEQEDGVRLHEVLNLGIGGFNLRASLNRLTGIGLTYDPNLIVYGWTINDIEGPEYQRTWKPGGDQSSPTFLLAHFLRERWRGLRDVYFPAEDSYIHELDVNYFENLKAWSSFLDDLDELARIGSSRDVCTVVFLHTMLEALHQKHPFERHYDAVAEAARQRGLFVVESFPQHRGRSPRPLWRGPHDRHPNREGHAILAEVLFDGIQSLPLRCLAARTQGP